MSTRKPYRTRQRKMIEGCLSTHADTYLSVDEVFLLLKEEGNEVGRTTVYRNLETLAQENVAIKAASMKGEARYRLAPVTTSGVLVCSTCGGTFPLDCHMLSDFAHHVKNHHGFQIDAAHTILYGQCDLCATQLSSE